MSFDFRTTGNVSPHPYTPVPERTLKRRSRESLLAEYLELQVQMAQMTEWATVAVDQIRVEKDAMAQVCRRANATIKAYEEAFDAKDAQIEALTAALVATRKKPATRVEVDVRTDYR